MEIIFDVTPETTGEPLLTLSAQNLLETLENPEGIDLFKELSLTKLVKIAKETPDLAFAFRLCTDIILNIRPEMLRESTPVSVHALYECLNLFHRFDGIYGLLGDWNEDGIDYLTFLKSKSVDTNVRSRLVVYENTITAWHAVSGETVLRTFLSPFFKMSLLSCKKFWADATDADEHARELKDFYIRLRDSIVDDFMYGLKKLPSFQLFTEKYGMPDEWEEAFYSLIYPALTAASTNETGN